jgi:8-oxo-dGTP diphosphatase
VTEARTTLLVSAAVLEHRGRILLTRRMPGDSLGGLWEFPGGKVEPGEDPMTTVARECREECGIDLMAIDILDTTFHAYEKRDVLLLFYVCRFAGAEQVVQHIEVDDHVWALPSEIRRYPLPPADGKVVSKIERGELARFR